MKLKHRDMVLIFIICLLPKLYLSLKASFLYIPADEVSTISVATNIAGLNWKDVTAMSGYYGIGFFFIFAPLYMLGLTQGCIYHIILICQSILESIAAILCYKTIDMICPKIERKLKCIISVLCGLSSLLMAPTICIVNESPLFFVLWVIVYLLSRIASIEEQKGKWRYEILIMIAVCYSLTLHTRAVVFIIGLWVISLLYFVLRRKLLFHVAIYIVMLAGYFVVRHILKSYQAAIWTGSEVRNTSVIQDTGKFLGLIETNGITIHTFMSAIRIIIGQLYSFCLMTGGLFAISITAFIIGVIPDIRNKATKASSCLLIVGGFALICGAGTMAGQAVTWLRGVYENDVYGFRAVNYTRYSGLYFSPLMMCGLIYIQSSRTIKRRSIIISTGIVVLLTILWQWKVYSAMPQEYIKQTNYVFMTLGDMSYIKSSSAINWLNPTLLLLEMMVLWLVLFIKRKEVLSYGLIACLLTTEYVYIYENAIRIDEAMYYERCNAGTELIQELSKHKQMEDVYVFDSRPWNFHPLYYEYQFANPQIHVLPTMPEKMDGGIVFSYENISDAWPKCWYVKLDNNEYVFFDGYEDYILMRKLGYTPELSIVRTPHNYLEKEE